MAARSVYSREELRQLRTVFRAGSKPECPRCLTPLEISRTIPPSSAVGYVRRRVWWVCPQCRRSAVLDG